MAKQPVPNAMWQADHTPLDVWLRILQINELHTLHIRFLRTQDDRDHVWTEHGPFRRK
jgi:hypothetical protein